MLVGLSDDEDYIFGSFLQRRGFMVRAFTDAGLALSAATDTPPVAIVTRHLQRGPMDGIELTRRVRAEQATRDVAVVVLTTRIEPAYTAAAVTAGCDGFLLLPASPDLVAYEVERVVASRAKKRVRAATTDSSHRESAKRSPLPRTMSTAPTVLSDEDAVRLMNAWRRLAAFMALADLTPLPSDAKALIHEFVEPAILDLNRLADQMPPAQLAATNQSPSSWFPNMQDDRWRRENSAGDKPASAADPACGKGSGR